MTPEQRAGGEVRLAGRTLSGVAMPYGTIAPQFQERFLPGAFGPSVSAPVLNIQHDRNMVVLEAGAYQLSDGPAALEVRAELPEGSAALALVRRGALRGFSVEFHARAERNAGGVRVVEAADLIGLGLVDKPAYPGATAEVRARGDRGGRLGTVRGRVPVDRTLDCRCSPGDCTEAIFQEGAFDGAPEKREVLAILDSFSDVIASKRREGVRLWRGEDGALEFAIDVPNNERGKALRDTLDVAAVYGRPVLDRELSEATVEGAVARYSRAEVRAILLGPTDASRGWDAVKMEKPEAREAPPAGRRVWL